MRYSTLLSLLVGISSVLAVEFGDQTLPGCSVACYKDILGRPGIRNCKSGDVLCFCDDYAILNAMQDCLSSTKDCGNGPDRTNTIYAIQEVCDNAIFAAAMASVSATQTDNGDDPVATNNPGSETTLPEPTSLEEAEARLGASASALINEQPFRLTTGQKAGIAIGSIIGFMILSSIGCCCGVYHYKNHVIKKMNANIQNSPATQYPAVNDDKATRSSWFTTSTGFKSHSRGATIDSHELGYGFDKELGLMISAPSNPRKYTTTKMRTVDIPESEHTIPRAPPPAASPHRSPTSPTVTSPARTMSLGSVTAAQRPSLMISPSTAVFPQATIEDYTPRNSIRVSVQSVHQKTQQAGPNINIPLMFFTPATPQVNNVSPTSPTSANGDIYGYYSRDSVGADNGIGIAQTSIDERTTPSPQPYDPTNNDYNISRTPSPAYTVNASQASPYNNYSTSPEPRNVTPGYDMSTDASSRVSSPSPTRRAGAGLHMPPRYAPYNSTVQHSFSPSPSPGPNELPQIHERYASPPPPPSQQKANQEMIDLSAMPVTINRSNSHAWRLSVERAADRAMDKVRIATTANAGFEEVPEEEERLTKSELPNTTDDARGRRKRRNQSQGSNIYNGTPSKADKASRSGSIGTSRSPSGNRRTSNGASGFARRSSSLGGYRNRTGSLSYNQIDGIPRVPRRNSRRGSNSSSVMMI